MEENRKARMKAIQEEDGDDRNGKAEDEWGGSDEEVCPGLSTLPIVYPSGLLITDLRFCDIHCTPMVRPR